MSDFGIAPIVSNIGELIYFSGVTATYNSRGDPTYAYTGYAISGVVHVLDGSEDAVVEGILNKEDIILFFDNEEPNLSLAARTENFATVVTSLSGVYQVVNVVRNPGHYEVHAKRIMVT